VFVVFVVVVVIINVDKEKYVKKCIVENVEVVDIMMN
jgi:hypothetical protein